MTYTTANLKKNNDFSSMYKIGLVIVHYMTLEDTINCTKSILENVHGIDMVSIAIVINEADDGSAAKLLRHKVGDQANVFYIETHANLGYARGCNAGIRFLRDEKKCDFVITSNNDVLFHQVDFINCIYNLYDKYKFSIAGPEILDINGRAMPNYPIRNYAPWRLRAGQVAVAARYIASFVHLDDIVSNLFNLRHKKEKKEEPVGKDSINIPLQGCLLIFSPRYFEKFDGFNEETFLYAEEDILFVRCQRKSLLMVYSPMIKITHVGGASTTNEYKNVMKIKRNKYINVLRSTNALIREIRH